METNTKTNQHKEDQLKGEKKIPLPPTKDTPLGGGGLCHAAKENYIIVDVPLDWPTGEDKTAPYTPPPEDYEKVIEASLELPIAKLGVLAKMEVERIYFDGLCGRARGHTKKATPFKNWIAYVIKCLWMSYNKGLLRGCRKPRTVIVKV